MNNVCDHNVLASFSDCYEFYSLNIILGIINHLTVHHDESLVQVWIIDWELLPWSAAATTTATELAKVEEEGSEEDTQPEGGKDEAKVICFVAPITTDKTEMPPDYTRHKTGQSD